MPQLNLVFAGTPEFAVPCLQAALASSHRVVGVFTQPDRPAGRGRQLTPSPVKAAALAAGVAVFQPETFKDADAQAQLAALKPDLMIVVAYGLILPKAVLVIPHLGCWNIHASLLPRWRGAAPIQRAISAGDADTGVCLMQMEAGLDTGPVLLREAIAISESETGGSLHDRLSELGARVLAQGLHNAQQAIAMPAAVQSELGVTYAHKLDKAEARLDLNHSAEALARIIRAFNPWPVAELELRGERLRVYQAQALAQTHHAAPGDILAAAAEGIDIATGEGVLRLQQVQRAGGKMVSARDYLNARPELKSAARS